MKDVPATMSAGRKSGKYGWPAAEGDLRRIRKQLGVVGSIVGSGVGVGSGTRAAAALKERGQVAARARKGWVRYPRLEALASFASAAGRARDWRVCC